MGEYVFPLQEKRMGMELCLPNLHHGALSHKGLTESIKECQRDLPIAVSQSSWSCLVTSKVMPVLESEKE